MTHMGVMWRVTNNKKGCFPHGSVGDEKKLFSRGFLKKKKKTPVAQAKTFAKRAVYLYTGLYCIAGASLPWFYMMYPPIFLLLAGILPPCLRANEV